MKIGNSKQLNYMYLFEIYPIDSYTGYDSLAGHFNTAFDFTLFMYGKAPDRLELF